jgi:RimJ/RimL family protein N-acetyltransferase
MLRGERVVLRGKRREDLPVQFEHDNDLEVLLVADDGPPVPWPLERLYRSFDRQAEEHDDSHTWFVIEVDGKVIGRKVYLSTGSHNERAIRCYRACGFVEEGRLRQQQWCAGEYIDVVYMGILREEWEARASKGK